MKKSITCDIFCNVVDNYGDVGVCWRLARQLADEPGLAVRLWVDNLVSLKRLEPGVDVALARPYCRGVEVRHWTPEAFPPLPDEAPAMQLEAGKPELKHINGEVPG